MVQTVLPTVSITSPATVSTTTGSTTFTYSPPVWTTTSDQYTIGKYNGVHVDQDGKIALRGKNADIEINGESLVSMLKRIEERINILTVNAELESEWKELKMLGDQYRALEQRILEKQKTWQRLRSSDSDNR